MARRHGPVRHPDRRFARSPCPTSIIDTRNRPAAGDTLIFTGTVADCGTGTLVMVSTGRGTTGGKTTSKWEVFEGLGTGDLARVHGTGTTAVAPNSDGTMMATLTGRITCD
jgi:hypothetical protein